MALDGLEARLRERFPVCHGKARNGFTWSDMRTTSSSPGLERGLGGGVRPLVGNFLSERGLSLSSEKTVVTHVDEGFDFLSQTVRAHQGKLLTRPSRKAIRGFLSRVREVIKLHRGASAGELVQRLNPMVRGWANYHRHGASSRTFASVDSAIWQALWRLGRKEASRQAAEVGEGQVLPRSPRPTLDLHRLRRQGRWDHQGHCPHQGIGPAHPQARPVKGEANLFDPSGRILPRPGGRAGTSRHSTTNST